MAGGKKDQKKKESEGRNSGFQNGVVILDLDEFDDEGRSIEAGPEMRRSAGNEAGMQGVPQSNESAQKEAEQMNKSKASVKDQNGSAPQQQAPKNPEEIDDDDILPEELENVSYELDKDVMGNPIISNRLPRNVVAKVLARRQQNNNNNINNNNLINNQVPPGNANSANQVNAPVQAPCEW